MQHRARAIWILVCLACGFTIISFNLIRIQLVEHERYWNMAVKNHLDSETMPFRRGSIFDSDGNLMAETQVRTDLFLDGKLVEQPAQQMPQLAQLIGVPAQSLLKHFDPRNRHQNVASDLDDDAVGKLKALKWRSLMFETRNVRFYPNNELGAHILGFVDGNGHGLAGVEKEMDKAMTGLPGVRWVEKDGKGKQVAAYQAREIPAIDGCDVTLTIKTSIQHIVETELDKIVKTYQPNGAFIIVMDPQTGEVLGMGSRPNFDPNNSKTFKPENIRNGCITDMYEPGSIFKTIPLAAALNEGAVKLSTPIFCENGTFYYGGKKLNDDEPNGTLPVIEVLAQSSNIGFAKIALNYLHEQKLYQYASAFGIGARTGLFTQQGESPGLLRPLSKWSALSITRIPMGQELQVTPIQMATAMSVIANGGRLIEPQLVKQIADASGRVVKGFSPKVVRRVISAGAARDVARALEQVTIDGTAKGVKIEETDGSSYAYAAKTGTAQKFVDGAYSHQKFVSSFLGFMPVQDPAFVALVMVDEPKTSKFYGAEVSGPVFASIARQLAQLMNLPADLNASSHRTVLSANDTEDR